MNSHIVSTIYREFYGRIPKGLRSSITIKPGTIYDYDVIVDCEKAAYISVNHVEICYSREIVKELSSKYMALQFFDEWNGLAYFRVLNKNSVKGHLINERKQNVCIRDF